MRHPITRVSISLLVAFSILMHSFFALGHEVPVTHEVPERLQHLIHDTGCNRAQDGIPHLERVLEQCLMRKYDCDCEHHAHQMCLPEQQQCIHPPVMQCGGEEHASTAISAGVFRCGPNKTLHCAVV